MTRRIAVGLALVGLLLACFGRLAAHPSRLLVDADRPSLDHARIAGPAPPGNDLTRLFLPHHLALARSVARLGRVPTWDDRGFGGRPLVGNPQAGLFYPPAWVAWWSGDPASLGWITFGHLLWASLGAYRLARSTGLRTWGSLAAAGCFSTSPYVLGQTFEGHYPHVWAASWYPWSFWLWGRVKTGDRRGVPGLALVLAASALTGHPQEGYYLAIALGVWAASDVLVAIRSGRQGKAVRLGSAWLGASALAVGLIAVELVPDAMAQGWGLRGARLPLHRAGQYHLDPTDSLRLFSPRALGGPSDYFGHGNSWETALSIGLVPMLLAAVGASWSADRRSVRGWLILVGAAVGFAAGRKLGLFAALYHLVPGMDRFRVPARSLFLASLGTSMLAGLGVEALRDRAGEDDRWRRLATRWGVLALMLAAVVLTSAARTPLSPSDPSRRVPETDRWLRGLARLGGDPLFGMALVGSTLGLAWGWRRPADRRAVAAALGLLGLAELGLYGHDLLRTAPADRFLGPGPIGEALLRARSPSPEPPRIRVVDSLFDDLRAGQSELTKANINDSFQIQHGADLYETLYPIFNEGRADRGAPMDSAVAEYRREVWQAVLDRMGVSLVVADREIPGSPWLVEASGLWRGSRFVVYRNPSALPRAYVVPRAEVAPDDASTVARFREVDPHRAVLMPADPLGPPTGPRQPFAPAEWVAYEPDRVALRVSTKAPGLLVVADTWMPGWTAEVDGRAAPVFRGNRAQRVIPLPKGGLHRVVLTYRAPGLAAGAMISAASALIGVGLSLRFRRPPGGGTDRGRPRPR